MTALKGQKSIIDVHEIDFCKLKDNYMKKDMTHYILISIISYHSAAFTGAYQHCLKMKIKCSSSSSAAVSASNIILDRSFSTK